MRFRVKEVSDIMESQKTPIKVSDEPLSVASNNRGAHDILWWVGLANVLLLRQSTGGMGAFNRRVPYGIFGNTVRFKRK